MRRAALIVTIVAILIATHLPAQERRDIDGAKDHPLISRFDDSHIAYSKTVKWDTYTLPISKIMKVDGQNAWGKKLHLEGEIDRKQYTTAQENSAAFVYRNYLSALNDAGWNILFSGNGANELGDTSYEWQFTMFQEGLGLGDRFGAAYNFRGSDYAYIAAHYQGDETSHYAMIYIVEKDDFTMIDQDIITVKNPDLGLVTAKQMTEKIKAKGHLALDGIFFETGKATLTDGSVPALKNIAAYLNDNRDRKFFVVGHTDNVGDFAANRSLSEERAMAVMHELVANYGVDAGQLVAHGIANLSPVTSNATETGRARNRRVEIVER